MTATKTREISADRSTASRMRVAVSEGRLSDAIELFERQKSAAPETALLRARIHLKKRNYAEAIAFLNRITARSLTRAQSSEALMLLGVAHSRSNRFTEADEYFERAASLNQKFTESG